MVLFAITSILLSYYLFSSGNGAYLPNDNYLVPNGGNHLSGSAGGESTPSAGSTIQNGPNDLPRGNYLIPNGGSRLSGSAGGESTPSAGSTIQNGPNDLPRGNYLIPNGGNRLSGSAGGESTPSAGSRIQNGPKDLPRGSYLIPNGGNQLSGAADGGSIPSAGSTIQNRPRDIPYYLPGSQQPEPGPYGPDNVGYNPGDLAFPNKYADNPSESGATYPSITVNSFNTAVSSNTGEPSSNQFADHGNDLDDF